MRPLPYVGPLPLDEEQTLFGRDSEIEELQWRVVADRIIVLYSASGAGKTSLLTAKNGLLSELRQRFHALPILRVSSTRGISPVAAILRQLEAAGTGAAMSGDTLLTYFERIAIPNPETPRRLLLVLDQFEEVFSGGAPLEEQRDFFSQLGRLLSREHSPVWTILSMREEYFSWLDAFRDHIPTRLTNTFRLNLLTQKQAIAAVKGPAAALGVSFPVENDTDAATYLVRELSKVRVRTANGDVVHRESDQVEAVQLQVICQDLWNRLSERGQEVSTIRPTDVRDFDPQDALQTYCGNALNRATSKPQRSQAVRDWVDHCLLTPSGLRAPAMVDPAVKRHPFPDELKVLEESHLIRRQSREGAEWYELSHDSLAVPVRRSIEEWRVAHLELWKRLARAWELGREQPNYFKTLPRRFLASIPLTRPDDVDAQVEIRFLDAYDAHLRHRRTMRVALAIAAGAMIASGMAYADWIRKEATLIAERNDTALQAGVLAILGDTPSIGLAARAAVAGTELQDRNASAVALNFNSLLSTFIHQTRNIEKVESEGAGEIRMAVFDREYRALATIAGDNDAVEIRNRDGEMVWRIDSTALKGAHQYRVYNVALLDNGLMATGGGDGDIQIWNIRTRKPVGPPLPARSGANGARMSGQVRAFARSGDMLYVGYEHGGVAAWKLPVQGGRAAKAHWNETVEAQVSDVAVSGDGSLLAIADQSDEEHITLVDFRQANAPKERLSPATQAANEPGGYYSVAVSPDGKSVAAGSSSGKIDIWTLPQKTHLRFQAHGQTVAQLKYLKEGELMSIGLDGRLKRWTIPRDPQSPPSGRTILELRQQLVSMAIDPNERSAVVTTDNGDVLQVSLVGDVHPLAQLRPGQVSWARLTGGPGGSALVIAEQASLAFAQLDRNAGIPAVYTRVPAGKIVASARAESIATTFLTDGKRVTAIPDGRDSVVDVVKLPDGDEKIKSLAVNHTGTFLIALTNWNTKVWSLSRAGTVARDCAFPMVPHSQTATFRPSSSDFVIAPHKTLQFWEVTERGGKCPEIRNENRLLDEKMGGFDAFAFHPDGSRLVASQTNGKTYEILLADGPVTKAMLKARSLNPPTAIAVSAGNSIAMGDALGGIRVLTPGAQLPMQIAQDFHQSRITSLSISDNGRRLVSTSSAGTAVWDLSIDNWKSRTCALARNRTFGTQDYFTYFSRVSEQPSPCLRPK